MWDTYLLKISYNLHHWIDILHSHPKKNDSYNSRIKKAKSSNSYYQRKDFFKELNCMNS
jgi:hypothetical protein